MKKKILKILKKCLIIYLIFYIFLSSMSASLARGYDEKCGEYVSQYARDYIEKYQSYPNTYDDNSVPAYWTGGSDGSGTFHVCCSTFVQYMYKQALGVDISASPIGISMSSDTTFSSFKSSGSTQYIELITNEADLKPGDILVRSAEYGASSGHMELYIGNGETADGGRGGNNNLRIATVGNRWGLGNYGYGLRLTNAVDVNPAGTVAISEPDIEEEDTNIYNENGFIYSGIPKIEGYKSSLPFGKWLISKLLEILDYLIGILTLAVRIVIVGWTAIVERFIIDGIVNAVTGVTDVREDDWEEDPDTIDDIDREAMLQDQNDNEQSQATGEPGDENYISEGVQGIADIGGKVQLNTSSKANITIGNIVYNKIPILDINFFNFESAGGAIIDKSPNGIIYLIKTNIAIWYYIFRIIAIIIMLLVLIYLGIQIAITSVAEKKATYKEMLVSWVVGILIIFIINYILFAIIHLNESFISWVIPKHENKTEIALYETVRSKAYEIKATTGTMGMIMYIIIVYYAIRFLIVYFKRFLTVTILALLSPFVGVAYALEKINKKGRGRGEVLGNLLKDFTYSVTLQSVHALIYTIFIQIILELTQISVIGMFISFMFLHFMVKMDQIWRKVFGFTAGNNTAKLSVDPLAPKIELAKHVGSKGKNYVEKYGKFVAKHVGGPIQNRNKNVMGNVQNKIARNVNAQAENLQLGSDENDTFERKKEKEEKIAAKRKIEQGISVGLSIGLNTALMFAKGVAVLPIMIVEGNLGAEILSSTISSKEKISKAIEKAKKDGLIPKTTAKGKRFYLKGIVPKNNRSAEKLARRLKHLNVNYRIEDYEISQKENINQDMTKSEKTFKSTQNAQQIKKLLGQTKIKNLILASGTKDVAQVLEEQGIEKTIIYSNILSEARKTETELQQLYEEIVGSIINTNKRIDGTIDIEENIDNTIDAEDNLNKEFINALQDKKTTELFRITKILSKPLSEQDIYKAIENYKSKTPTFNSDAEIITQRDIEGIAKEINSIFKSKGEEVEMSKEFIEKVKKNVDDTNRRKQQTEAVHVAEVDLTPKVEDESVQERKKTIVKNDSQNIGKNVDSIVESIKNASKGSDSKNIKTVSRATIKFARNIDKLQELSDEASSITGEDLYDIDKVLERIKKI